MNLTIEDVARAFSGHDFEAAYPYLADRVVWTIVGEERLEGKAEVIAACERTAAYLAQANTEFQRLRALVGDDRVVIDSLAEYTDSDGSVSAVDSCDLYDFEDGKLIAIATYNISVGDKASSPEAG